MNGYEKTAVLFGELGAGACEEVLGKLNLSTAQIKKIQKAMRKIRNYGEKAYNPNDSFQIKRELEVLEELKEFGEFRKIYKEVPHDGLIKTTESAQERIKNAFSENPESIARALSKWLSEE